MVYYHQTITPLPIRRNRAPFVTLCEYNLGNDLEKITPQKTYRAIFSVLLFTCRMHRWDKYPPPDTPDLEVSITPITVETATLTSSIAPTIDPDIPLAASVNGQAITLETYQSELKQAQAVPETGLKTYSDNEVLQNLIDEVLLMQGANEAGFMPDDALVQARISQLGINELALQDWITDNDYTQEGFDQALRRSISAAWMRDQIIAQVPSTAEQVHARQILLYNSDEAENIYAQLQAGTDFATLAIQYDPLTTGDLGWFPKGYLTVPELDEPVFSLQPGEYTGVIETTLGYHIVQVIEKNDQYPLSPGAYQTFQVQSVQNWLVERRGQSDIQILLP